MKFTIKINSIKSIEKIEGFWKNEDYKNLLEEFDFTDADSLNETEYQEMLLMAITDFEPDEAAEIILKYKLSDKLNEGQITNLSHEMLEDKVAEEYPDISMHYPLFNINQLLRDAYNGKFPSTIASVIEFELDFKEQITITKEIVLRAISDLLSDKSLLKRLFQEKLDSEEQLNDADSIIWELHKMADSRYQIISSKYWMDEEDFEFQEFSGELREEEIGHT
ncbi:MAG: hypothetical protein HKN92_11985 [Chitinophagales bacterium]|nr:hypothetical protein [Chitinophagales bacterium]